jgi:hypothetical protein
LEWSSKGKLNIGMVLEGEVKYWNGPRRGS